MLQSMVKYPIEDMSPVFLYLATKIEEDFKAPKYIFEAFKLKPGESNDQQDLKRREELLFHHEKILVQTLGFDFIIDHPHSLIDSAGRQLKRSTSVTLVPKDIVNTAFFIATFSLHVTCLSLMYSRSYLAVLCIFVACKWAKYELPKNPEKPWWHVVDPNLNLVKFERILDYLDNTCGKCPQNQMVLLTKAKIYDRNGDLRSYQDFINEPALNGQSHQSENNEKPGT
ncbi:Cyclin-T1 [Thelohanellus kitauei]|uniref:Cyclin-T1 n=1 Tax=Thelohanellus kitauei TaxID=669202 RepID=A0A0C2J6Q9_THEKT|nr:Cyclin-T1 [Thelohanellus kitauei]